MESLTFLTYLAIILLLGIICTIISQRLRIPNVLLLLLAGVLLGYIQEHGIQVIRFPAIFLSTVGILALVMVVFDSTSRFKLKEFGELSLSALKMSIIFILLNIMLLSVAVIVIFRVNSIFLALLFATLMSGTDPGTVLAMFKKSKNKVLKLLEIESIINTPLCVLLPFIILNLKESFSDLEFSTFMNELLPFLQKFVTGIGAGILVGLVVFRIMKRQYSETLSPLAIITAALLTYILAENLGGSGVLAVTAIGLLFGSVYVKEKLRLYEFSAVFATSFEILVFVLIGLSIKIPLNMTFILKSVSLFGIYILIRFSSIHLAFYEENIKEKVFMALNAQKGITVAVVTFMLMTIGIQGLSEILDLILMFMFYSIVLSTIVAKHSKYWIKTTVS